MRVLLNLDLDCDVDAAWRALRSPLVLRAVMHPVLGVWPLDPDGFPQTWAPGDHHVEISALTVLNVGEQLIRISYPQATLLRRRDAVRMIRDSGRPTSGLLTVVTKWEHTMAVSPAAGGRTRYRDQLKFSAGILTPLVWAAFWVFWQYRALRIRSLARSWQ